MLAAQAAVTPSLKASFRPRISPHERQNQLPFREIAKRDCEKEFWPFLGPTIRATVLVGLTSVRSGVQLPKIPRPSCPQSHNQLMLIAWAPQNHKLNFKCKTTRTVAGRFFESSLETHARDSGLAADHATGETYDRRNHATSLLYRDVVAVRRGGVSIFA